MSSAIPNRDLLPLGDPESMEPRDLFVTRRREQEKQELRAANRRIALSERVEEPSEPTERAAPEDGGFDAGDVARDVGSGLLTAGGSAVRGVKKELAGAVLALRDLDRFWQEKTGVPLFVEGSGVKEKLQQSEARLEEIVSQEERTVTGSIIRDTVGFLTGFIPVAGQLGKIRAVQQLGTTGRIAKNAVAGFAAEFALADTSVQASEATLESLITEHPELREPVEAMLADETGSEAIAKRTKAGLIGAGLGVVADGAVLALRAIRHARRIRAQAAVEPPEITVDAKDVRLAEGFGEDDLVRQVSLSKKALRAAEREIREASPDLTPAQVRAAARQAAQVEINFDRIDTDADVVELMAAATNLFESSVDTARRGVRSNEATQEAADVLGLSLSDVLSRRGGQALNAEESLAFRRIWVASAEKLAETARGAEGPAASAADLVKFRRMLAIHHAINQQVLGARAEAGRALQQWRIVAGGGAERARAISSLMEAHGGERVSQALARRFRVALDSGATPAQISQFTWRGVWANTLDAVQESYVLGLLWKPSTHMVNLTSNTLVPLLVMGERMLARGGARVLDADDLVAEGEVGAQLTGLAAGLRSMFRMGADAEEVLTRTRDAIEQTTGKLDIRTHAISSEAFGLSPDSGVGKAIDLFGNVTRAPGVLLQAEDRFFKTIGYQMELHAQAQRQAVREGLERGWDAERVALRMGELVNDPPERIRMASVDAALYQTFTQQTGEIGKGLHRLRAGFPPLTLFLPFIRTPMNLLSFTFERTPLAPLVGQWRADIAKGGAERSLALSRMALGTAAMSLFADWAYEGHVMGALPRDPGLKEAFLRQGLPPDHFRFGNETFRFNRVDPFGIQLSMAASFAQLVKGYEQEEEDLPDWSEITAAMAVATSDSVLGKTWFTGVSRFVKAMSSPERSLTSVTESTVSSLLPFSSLLRAVRDVASPEQPQTSSISDAVQAMIVGLQDRLPRRRTLWGDPIVVDRINVLLPGRVETVKLQPVDEEIIANGGGITRIRRRGEFQGVPVNFREFPRVYEAYVTLAGNKLKIGGLGARDRANRRLQERNFLTLPTGPDSPRMDQIRQIVRKHRQAAQVEIMQNPQRRPELETDEVRAFRAYVQGKQRERVTQAARTRPTDIRGGLRVP